MRFIYMAVLPILLCHFHIAAQQDSCFPPCRSGYVCHNGSCIENCNPPCPNGEKCTGAGECVPANSMLIAPVSPAAPSSSISTQSQEHFPNPISPLKKTKSALDTTKWISALDLDTIGSIPGYFTLSGGYGSSHAGLGIKATIAIWILGLGVVHNTTICDVGLKVPIYNFDQNADAEKAITFAYNHLYLELNYGDIAVKDESYISSDGILNSSTETVLGWTVNFGGKWFIGDSKIIIIEGAIGWNWGKTTFFNGTPYQINENISTFTYDIGIGLNLGHLLFQNIGSK